MAIPNIILETLRVTAEFFEQSAANALTLAEAWEETGTYPAFLTRLASFVPGISRTVAGAFYRVARYWSNQGDTLSQLDANRKIPEAVARPSEHASKTMGHGTPYRYRVELTLEFPANGDIKVVSTYVSSNRLLSPNDAFDMAIDQLNRIYRHGTSVEGKKDTDPFVTDARITDFARFQPFGDPNEGVPF